MGRFCVYGCLPIRVLIGIMICFSCIVSSMVLVNMSINIIAMIEPTNTNRNYKSECVVTDSNSSYNYYEPSKLLDRPIAAPNYGVRYSWTPQIQGLVLGAYFWGFILTPIPAGFLAERFDPSKIVAVTGFALPIINFLTPVAASWHYSGVMLLRFLIGLISGMLFPCLHCLISKWSPPQERGIFISALLGGNLGAVITLPLLGVIIENWGWTWSFYIPGIICLIWCFLWVVLVSDSPENHRMITEEEKTYIVTSIGSSTAVDKVKVAPPYLKILTSIPFWALNILHFGNLWGLNFLVTAGPKFLSEALGLNLEESGGLSAVPYLTRTLTGVIFGCLGDVIRTKNWMTVTATRKWFVVISHIIPGLFMFSLILVGCNASVSVILITIALGFNGASVITNLQNNQDLAPNFAASVFGIINTFGGMTGFLTPIVTGQLTAESDKLHQWHLIFCVGASVYIASGLIFCAFGTGETQPWNEPTKTNIQNVDNPDSEHLNYQHITKNCLENTQF